MHDIGLERSIWGDLTITHAKATAPLIDPFEGLNSTARNKILFAPLSRNEREIVRAARKLTPDERRVIAHHILTDRRRGYEANQVSLAMEAKRLRDEDIVVDENQRQSRYLDFLAQQAEAKSRRRGGRDR